VTDVPLAGDTGFPSWAARRSVWFVIAIHLPFVVFPPVDVITRRPGLRPGEMVLIALLSAALGGLQLRHSLAAAHGRRPVGWPLSLALVIAAAYGPGAWLAFDWVIPMQWFAAASAAMLLPRRLAIVTVAVPVAVIAVLDGIHDHQLGFGYPQTAFFTFYYAAVMVMGAAALYGSARLAKILGDLFAARTEIAEQALDRERFRVSRDLHDLLGHSLSAVSLKGDLAMRLMVPDPAAARREIEGLTDVARTALRDMRAVARAEHDVALAAEAASARAVLEAAGIRVSVAVDLLGLSPALDAVLAWTVREGATNVLRHSEAAACTIRAWRQDGRVQLEIVNDGAGQPADAGSGLAGLAARASALGGTATGSYAAPGEFTLRLSIPETPS
jgi:two-component system sensor histidine kinase DesK